MPTLNCGISGNYATVHGHISRRIRFIHMANIDIEILTLLPSMPVVGKHGRCRGCGLWQWHGDCRECAKTGCRQHSNNVRCRPIKMRLGKFGTASLSVMQAGEPLASDGPIMDARASARIKRVVICPKPAPFCGKNKIAGFACEYPVNTGPE